MSSAIDVPVHIAVAILIAAGVVPEKSAVSPRAGPVARSESVASISDERWLATLHAHGEEAGIALARRIYRTGSGRIYVPVVEDHQQIVGLKRNAVLVSRVLALEAKATALELERDLGRPATMSEIYAAYVLGPKPAAELITAAAADPRRPSIEVLPAAALGFPELFFERTRPRASAAVLELLSTAFEKALQSDIGQRRASASQAEMPKSRPAATHVNSTLVRR